MTDAWALVPPVKLNQAGLCEVTVRCTDPDRTCDTTILFVPGPGRSRLQAASIKITPLDGSGILTDDLRELKLGEARAFAASACQAGGRRSTIPERA